MSDCFARCYPRSCPPWPCPSVDFVPFIVTAVLPTVISAQWRGVDSHRLTRDEQTWLSTCYVQVYAFLQVPSYSAYFTRRCVLFAPLWNLNRFK